MLELVDEDGHGRAAPLRQAAAIVVEPLAPGARFSLRLRAAAALEIGTVADFRLDTPINRCSMAGERISARLGPDEWLLLGPDAECGLIARDIDAALKGVTFSLVDIGHRNLGFAVAGTRAREVINGGCPLDLDDAAFSPGAATRTLFGKAESVLLRAASERAYRVECWRSFAPYVHGLLKELAREFETG